MNLPTRNGSANLLGTGIAAITTRRDETVDQKTEKGGVETDEMLETRTPRMLPPMAEMGEEDLPQGETVSSKGTWGEEGMGGESTTTVRQMHLAMGRHSRLSIDHWLRGWDSSLRTLSLVFLPRPHPPDLHSIGTFPFTTLFS